MQRKFWIIISIILSISLTPVWAENTVEGLNTATVPISSQSAEDLHPALVKAFIQCLIKMSGNPEIGSIAAIKEQSANVERFVQQYSYSGLTIQVTFDRRTLMTLLTQSGQGVWAANRPSTLIFLSIDDQVPLAGNSSDPTLSLLKDNALRRGLPVSFPTMNVEDQADWETTMQGSSITQESLEKIANRYQSPAILWGEVSQGIDQVWIGRWFFAWRAQTWQWHSENLTKEAVMQAGIDKVADLMAKQLAVNLNQQATNNLWVAILNVNNLDDYNQVLINLKQMSPILAVMVQDVGRHGVLLRLTTTGEGNYEVKNALAANPHFSLIANQTFADVLRFRWSP